MEVLGIDIGGSGIKGAPVNIKTGSLTAPRLRIETPKMSTPESVSDIIIKIVNHFNWKGIVGCGFPAVIRKGTVLTAANIDKSWIGVNASKLFEEKSGCKTYLINDADAAGMAEIKFGAGKNISGIILLATVGTGIGTAIFNNGVLLPNTEFGHLEINGKEIEKWASDGIRKKKDLSWQKWAKRFNCFLATINNLIWPDLIIIGGGISKKFELYSEYLKSNAKIVPAELLNEAGIIGAAAWTQSSS